MRNQNPIEVIGLSIITFGIYSIFWYARTRGEMVRLGADIPTTWLIIIPLINYWYYWKWANGVEKVTSNKTQAVIAFILVVLLGMIGGAIIQDSFNKNSQDQAGDNSGNQTAGPTAPSSSMPPSPIS